MLDIFNSNAFSIVRLTQAINQLTYVPGRIGQLGLFGVDRVDTTIIAVETKGDILSLVAPTPRGAPGQTLDKEKRNMRALMVPHFEINDAVYADEVQNIRSFGGDGSNLESVVAKVAQRQAVAARSMAATEEHARMGAVQGIVTYADGSTLNLFTEFGVAQETEIDFDLDNASPVDGVLRKKCAGITRQVQEILGGIGFTGLHAFCGDAFFDDLLSHPEVRETYKGWGEAQILRESYIGPNRMDSYGVFEFGGIVWENYRGAVGTTSFIDTNKCHIFPLGVPDLFKSVYAPADYVETVNTLGERLYTKQYPFPNDKGVHLDTQMNALQYASRPRVLIKGKRT